MLIVGNHVPDIPSSDLFDDLLRRNSLTEDAYSPIDTEAEEIKAKYLDDHTTTVYMQIDWLYNRGDRIKKLDIDKLKRGLSELTDGDCDIDGDMCFFSRNSKLQEALLNCFVGAVKLYRYIDKNGYKKDLTTYRVQKSVVVHDDDGDKSIQVGELENVDNEVVKDFEKVALSQKIGYYLKMFHEGSKRKGVSLLSFIIAYLRANHGMAPENRLNNKKYVAQNIYRVDLNGNCVSKYNENHNTSKAWGEQATWFYNRHDKEYQDIYNVLVDEFMDLCMKAGIDLAKEDPTDFTADVIDSITTTYIMSNMEFVDNYLGKIDSSVFKCLSPDRLLKPGSAVIMPDVDSVGCYFMDAFVDDVLSVLNTNYSPDKSFVKKQQFYTRKFDKEALYVSNIPYAYLWYYMASVYMKLYNQIIGSDSYKVTTVEALLKDINNIRLKAFRITAARIFKNPDITMLQGMVQSQSYISFNENYYSWRLIDRFTDLSLNDYIICERNELNDVYKLTLDQLRTIPEKFIISDYGCVVGQKYSSESGLRGFEVYKLEDVTEFLRGLIYANTAADRKILMWPEPEEL